MSPFKIALAAVVVAAAVGANPSCSVPHDKPAPASPTAPSDQFGRDLLNELTHPLPYNGGDPNGPCGSWGAATKADADQMDAAWHRCMANHRS